MNTIENSMNELILASTSPWRKQILENAGFTVTAIASNVDESRCVERDPKLHAAILARWKAQAVFERFPDAVVIGADQVMWDGRRVCGKPKDASAHFDMLARLRGQTHWLHTAFVILGPNIDEHRVVSSALTMRGDLSDRELKAYVDTGEGRFCAGGYAIEGHGSWLFESIDGDWLNIIGLPVLDVVSCLRGHGWTYGT